MQPLLAAAGLSLAALAPAGGPGPVLFQNVRLAPDAEPKAMVLVRDGRLERVRADDFIPPPDARAVDGAGGLVLPAFVDAYSFAGCATPEPRADRDQAPSTSSDVLVDMRAAGRKGLQPAFRAADVFGAPDDGLKPWREAGFGALLSAPAGQILAGQSALAVTRDAAPRDAIVRASVFDHAGFSATGGGYPSTLMGSIAHLRQFLLDARWHAEIEARRAAGKPGPRAPFDADLEAILPALHGERRVCCEAQTADAIDRWLALADAHGFQVVICGGREAWRRAEVLAERRIPVLLTLDWGEEPADPDAKDDGKKGKDKKKDASPEDEAWTYEEPLAARREKRRQWVETRDGALRLAGAGVPFAFGTAKDKPSELLGRVRQLVEAGLPRTVALRALTSGAAALLGAEGALGQVEEGRPASFALWTADPLTDKEAKVAWLVVDGYALDLRSKEKEKPKESKGKKGDDEAEKPGEGVDASGAWTLDFGDSGVPDASLELAMEPDGATKGTLRGRTPNGTPVEAQLAGRVAGAKLTLSGTATVGGAPAKFDYEGQLEGSTWTGELAWSIGDESGSLDFTGTRTPKEERR